MIALAHAGKRLHWTAALMGMPVVRPGVLTVEDESVGKGEMVGMVGTGAMVPAVGDTPIVGTAAAELTPRLPISIDPRGIPVRATPPGVVGEVGVEDEATLVEPEPHIPDKPDVSSAPPLVGIAEVADVSRDVEAPVAGVAVPTAIPPPS
jgi:hypothetical protein